MSFGPPPTKTPYGDQDFIEEDDTTQQRPLSPPPIANQNLRGYSAYSVPPQPPPPTQSPYGLPMPPVNGVAAPAQPDFRSLTKSLTPEDMLFMRSWRQDSFYYRVLPLTAVGSGALYYYNKIKNLPQKTSRYMMVSVASYFIGKWSYKEELRRRLEATPLNTPFIQSLRALVGAQAPLASMGGFSGDATQDYSAGLYNKDQPVGWGSSDVRTGEGGFPRRGPPMGPGSGTTLGQPAGYSQFNPGQPDSTYQPYDSDLSGPGAQAGGEPPKPVYSYEELRARNRGLIQK